MFAGVAAGIVVAIGLPVADLENFKAGLSATGIAQVVGGAAFGGAVMGVAGVLLGTVTRNPTIASSAVVGLSIGENLINVAGIGPHMPFGLVRSLVGMGNDVSVLHGDGPPTCVPGRIRRVRPRMALPRDLT